MTDEVLLERLRELYANRDTTNFGVMDLLHAVGSPLEALMYARLFWPEFVEMEGMVFLKETVEDEDDRQRFWEAYETHRRDRRRTEESLNLIEVTRLFGARGNESSPAEDRCLADRLATMWRARLATIYPDRSFVVDVVQVDPSDPDEIGIVFYQR